MKLQKYMSQAGICSRRQAEKYIRSGFVFVNETPAHIGQVIDPEKDEVRFEDEILSRQENLLYYKMNKPYGVVTTCAPREGGETILDWIDESERIFPIGRLDKNTTGLILLTNDGRLSNYLMHPRYEHEKEYVVTTYGALQDNQLEKLQAGVKIPLTYMYQNQEKTKYYITKSCLVKRLASRTCSITLKEGKNRQVRKMVQAVGAQLKKLKRIRIENITLGNLQEGEYIPFTHQEKDTLLEQMGIFFQ